MANEIYNEEVEELKKEIERLKITIQILVEMMNDPGWSNGSGWVGGVRKTNRTNV